MQEVSKKCYKSDIRTTYKTVLTKKCMSQRLNLKFCDSAVAHSVDQQGQAPFQAPYLPSLCCQSSIIWIFPEQSLGSHPPSYLAFLWRHLDSKESKDTIISSRFKSCSGFCFRCPHPVFLFYLLMQDYCWHLNIISGALIEI